MSDDEDTTSWHPAQAPQPTRSDTEYNLHVQSGPLDSKWFHTWRRELRDDLKDIKSDLSAVNIAQTRIDQRMDQVTDRISRVEQHVRTIDTRVVDLENSDAIESKILKRAKQGWLHKAGEGAAGQVGAALVLGATSIIVWLLWKFFQEYKP